MKTSELIEKANMLLEYGAFDSCDDYDKTIIEELADRLEQYDKALGRVATEISNMDDECPKGCMCELEKTCVENLKEWLLRGDAE